MKLEYYVKPRKSVAGQKNQMISLVSGMQRNMGRKGNVSNDDDPLAMGYRMRRPSGKVGNRKVARNDSDFGGGS